MKAESISASEFLHLVADALYATHVPKFQKCTEPGCENKIRRGVRCEPCMKIKRQAQDRAYEARRAKSRKESKARPLDESIKPETEASAV